MPLPDEEGNPDVYDCLMGEHLPEMDTLGTLIEDNENNET